MQKNTKRKYSEYNNDQLCPTRDAQCEYECECTNTNTNTATRQLTTSGTVHYSADICYILYIQFTPLRNSLHNSLHFTSPHFTYMTVLARSMDSNLN